MNAIDLHKAIIMIAKHRSVDISLGYYALQSTQREVEEAWELIFHKYNYNKISKSVYKRCIDVINNSFKYRFLNTKDFAKRRITKMIKIKPTYI